MYVYIYIHTYIQICICMYIHKCIHMYTYMYYIYIDVLTLDSIAGEPARLLSGGKSGPAREGGGEAPDVEEVGRANQRAEGGHRRDQP